MAARYFSGLCRVNDPPFAIVIHTPHMESRWQHNTERLRHWMASIATDVPADLAAKIGV